MSELLNFLEHQMSMQAVYQPLVVLHLLTRGGFATRLDLARTLSGYDEVGIEIWDRILMKNPKFTLVDTHGIVSYDKDSQAFTLEFDLFDSDALSQARRICEDAVLTWIQKRIKHGQLEETEVLRHYRSLELAKRGEQYGVTSDQDQLDEIAVEDFALGIAASYLQGMYPDKKVTQQPYNTPGFDLLIGDASQPTAFVKVKSSRKLTPCFSLSEGDRCFSIEKADQYLLAIVYAINLNKQTHEIKIHKGAIKTDLFSMVPLHWQAIYQLNFRDN
jgi:hypothetical protein